MRKVLCCDFGGTNLAVGLFDQTTNKIIASEFCPTPIDKTAVASRENMFRMAEQLLERQNARREEIAGIGISFNGPVEPDHRRPKLSPHIIGWEQFDLAKEAENRLDIPLAVVGNDAQAAALAENKWGAGQNAQNMIYMTVSTGIGGGIIINGEIFPGSENTAGEFGHMILYPDGPLCPCGNHGCLESLSSGLSIARDARLKIVDPAFYPESLLREIPHEEITAKKIAELAEQQDPLALEIWNYAMDWLGIGVYNAVRITNPNIVVLGGGLTRSGDLLFDPVRRKVNELLKRNIPIVPTMLGENIGLYGAAAVYLSIATL